MNTTSVGELVQFISRKDRKSFLLILQKDKKLEIHYGVIMHLDIIGQPYASLMYSHRDAEFLALIPSTSSITHRIKRKSQLIFPKDPSKTLDLYC